MVLRRTRPALFLLALATFFASGRPAKVMRPVRLIAVLAALAGGLSLLAASADAYVYWAGYVIDRTGPHDGHVGRANLDGSGVNQSFITASYAAGLAVDSGHLYWAEQYGRSIGRARLNGSGVNQSFLTSVGQGVAVDRAHIYWGNYTGSGSPPSIGRANLDGTGINQSFISLTHPLMGAYCPESVAVDGGHVYWADACGGSIGRANLDGTGVNQSFIATGGRFVAVDGGHIYWSTGSTIGRANLDGSGVNQSFITVKLYPAGLAVDDAHIYWAFNAGGPRPTHAIGRANLDGSGVNHSFITLSSLVNAVAVDGLGSSGGGAVTALGVSPVAFAAASSGPSATAAARTGTGATVTFRLNRAGRVRFTAEKPAAGRRVRGRCVAPSRSNRLAPRCTRYPTVRGSFTRTGRKGSNRFHFTGRMGGHKLAPGGYRLVAIPTGGQAKRTSFRIKP